MGSDAGCVAPPVTTPLSSVVAALEERWGSSSGLSENPIHPVRVVPIQCLSQSQTRSLSLLVFPVLQDLGALVRRFPPSFADHVAEVDLYRNLKELVVLQLFSLIP